MSSHLSTLISPTSLHSIIEHILPQAHGDLKYAIHLFQLNCVLPSLPISVDPKDLSRSVFQELGHLLYNKRDPTVLCSSTGLPTHLQMWHRPHPFSEMSSYLARLPVSSTTFAWLLHANWYPFFRSLSSYAFLSQHMALADQLSLYSPHALMVVIWSTMLAHGIEAVWEMNLEMFWEEDDEEEEKQEEGVNEDMELEKEKDTPTPHRSRPSAGVSIHHVKSTSSHLKSSSSSSSSTFLPMQNTLHYKIQQQQQQYQHFLRLHRLRATEVSWNSIPSLAHHSVDDLVKHVDDYVELEEDPILSDMVE
ncbi:hypothetical protein HMI54_008870 [Coelomomyces lativittatus]|nr:hypothetical protein HMI56_001361 [Coelomomyces lativittatus]KAJ1516589.1 hypothetical protein HMI54_008870 [Coelomomyces lativittatus]